MKQVKVLNDLVQTFNTAREFCLKIGVHQADLIRWRSGKTIVSPRAVIAICKYAPYIQPHDLNPDVFPKGLTFNFGDEQ